MPCGRYLMESTLSGWRESHIKDAIVHICVWLAAVQFRTGGNGRGYGRSVAAGIIGNCDVQPDSKEKNGERCKWQKPGAAWAESERSREFHITDKGEGR
jgi:hypothetical protein